MDKKGRYEVVIAGLGGSGLLTAGKVLVEAGASVFKNVFYLPNYGPAMRMGECECTVTFSNEEIIAQGSYNPTAAMVFGSGAMSEMVKRLKPGGAIFVDSSLVPDKLKRDDIDIYYIPATRIAQDIGSATIANIVLMGAYLEKTKVLAPEAVEKALKKRLSGKKGEHMLELNRRALKAGADFITSGAQD